MGYYNFMYFLTLVLPISIGLGVMIIKYVRLKEKYLSCLEKYSREFRETKEYECYVARKKRTDRILDYFRYKDIE